MRLDSPTGREGIVSLHHFWSQQNSVAAVRRKAFKIHISWAGKTAQQAVVLAAKSVGNASLIPCAHMVKGESQLPRFALWSPHACSGMHACFHTHKHTQEINVIIRHNTCEYQPCICSSRNCLKVGTPWQCQPLDTFLPQYRTLLQMIS